jgi:16S rRNA (cytosine1402-N4)-methyltransferase
MIRAGVPGGTPCDTDKARARHIPVLLSEVLESLAPRDGDFIIDGTFGAGGYSRAILESAACRVLAFDRDITAIRAGASIAEAFAGRLYLVNEPFSRMEDVARRDAAAIDVTEGGGAFVDAIVLDIGVSSMQLDAAERGFSFQSDGPLDMRMAAPDDSATSKTASESVSAADFLNAASEQAIANVIYTYGEERRSRAIARAIVKAREKMPLSRTGELAEIVARVFHGRKVDGRHPATRTFQALRIYVNDELGELAKALHAAERILKPGGRLVVVTFHSLEDRIVKKFFTMRSGRESKVSRHLPEQYIKFAAPSFRILNSRPLTPSKGECEVNPRARSARLRAGVRTEGPPQPLDFDELAVPQPDI